MSAFSAMLGLSVAPLAAFNLSNTLGDGMVLQRGNNTLVWGFGDPGVSITTTFLGQRLLPPTVIDANGVWRQALPPTEARKAPTTIDFQGSDGNSASLRDVLFGDVFLCSGQSNQQYTPRSMKGMNNMSAEIAAADAYSDTMRFFTVGQDTTCGDPAKNQTDCSHPFSNLNTRLVLPCRVGKSCRHNWGAASASSLGGAAWDNFSAACWLTGRDIHDGLGGTVPIGLISSNWGGTAIQLWQPAASAAECRSPPGVLYNSMIAPFAFGPMALTGVTWYQGEANVGQAATYACHFPAMVEGWRAQFNDPTLWFGFVQIQWDKPPRPETQHSLAAGDLRQAQLTALALPRVGMSTAIDVGDWVNIHPPDKQSVGSRLARQALAQVYGLSVPGADFPLYAGSELAISGSEVTVTVKIRAAGEPVKLTADAPAAATASSTLGQPGSVPRNRCVTAGYADAFPQDCGYPAVLAVDTQAANASVSLNASITIGEDGSSLVLRTTDFDLRARARRLQHGPRLLAADHFLLGGRAASHPVVRQLHDRRPGHAAIPLRRRRDGGGADRCTDAAGGGRALLEDCV